MVSFSELLTGSGNKIHVVYHEWLEDCLKEKRVVPVASYLAIKE